MPLMNNHLIIQNIRRSCLRHFLYPALVLVLSFLYLRSLPIQNHFSPIPIRTENLLADFYNSDAPHVVLKGGPLNYTGYDYIVNGKTAGYYYYSLDQGRCQFYILSSHAGSVPALLLDQVNLKGTLLELPSDQFQSLIKGIALDLQWKENALLAISSPFVFSDISHQQRMIPFLAVFLCLCILLSLVDCACTVFYFAFPHLAPAFSYLRATGNIAEQLLLLEAEIRQEPLIYRPNLFLTPNYLVILGNVTNMVFPIRKLKWIYYHQYTDRFFFMNRHVYASLHIVTKKGRNYSFSRKETEDVDFVLKAIEQYFPQILTGYSEENRMAAKKSGPPTLL